MIVLCLIHPTHIYKDFYPTIQCNKFNHRYFTFILHSLLIKIQKRHIHKRYRIIILPASVALGNTVMLILILYGSLISKCAAGWNIRWRVSLSGLVFQKYLFNNMPFNTPCYRASIYTYYLSARAVGFLSLVT